MLELSDYLKINYLMVQLTKVDVRGTISVLFGIEKPIESFQAMANMRLTVTDLNIIRRIYDGVRKAEGEDQSFGTIARKYAAVHDIFNRRVGRVEIENWQYDYQLDN